MKLNDVKEMLEIVLESPHLAGVMGYIEFDTGEALSVFFNPNMNEDEKMDCISEEGYDKLMMYLDEGERENVDIG